MPKKVADKKASEEKIREKELHKKVVDRLVNIVGLDVNIDIATYRVLLKKIKDVGKLGYDSEIILKAIDIIQASVMNAYLAKHITTYTNRVLYLFAAISNHLDDARQAVEMERKQIKKEVLQEVVNIEVPEMNHTKKSDVRKWLEDD